MPSSNAVSELAVGGYSGIPRMEGRVSPSVTSDFEDLLFLVSKFEQKCHFGYRFSLCPIEECM